MKKIFLLLLLTSLLHQLLLAQVNLPLGLKAYYPFTGNANDVSGNNNNPIFNNAVLTADRLGNPNSAYHFNGTSSYMRIPNSSSLNMTNQMSISVWVKPMGFYAGPCHGNTIVMKGDGDFLPGNYMLRFDDNAFTNGANCSGTPVNTTNQNYYGVNAVVPSPGYTPYIQQGQWSSVIYTTDGITAKLYVNCVLKYSGPHGSNTFTNTYDLFFGRLNSAQFPYWLNGDLDEVRIYDRALNQDEVNVLGGCTPLNPCDTWLRTINASSFVEVGDLDVSGNKLTVEATFNRSTPPVANSYGFLVSKHTNSNDLNYALWPNGCSVVTTNGQKFATENCGIELNKTYHVAMVYDGATLKFYRNGFLHSQTPATGNLVLNNLLTRINSDALVGLFPFNGYTNEIRIWNVARTQAELRTYMNTSLPNPTTQTGLLGYYTFDNLLNKQGNAAYNGVLNGGATINNTVPNCNYVADSCVIPQVPCNNWLKFPNQGTADNVAIGDLDVSGNKITVEALYSASFVQSQNIISKHFGPADVNYLLRPYHAQITTTNGFFNAEISCSYEANKIYHAAMVYDGSTLKYYRNGFLMTSVPASGNLITNNWVTRIGNKATLDILEPFTGHINEVRIWNTARTQTQIQSNMFTSLANPTTQTGLLAYYTFDNLLNKQGNATYNGVLNGGTTINNTVPNCNYVADSCGINNNCLDSVRFTTNYTCRNVSFFGQVFPNSTNIQTWQWYFGDGGTATGQNTSHDYALSNTNYTVKLVVTTLNGCKDSISRIITTPVSFTNVDFSNVASCRNFSFTGSSFPGSLAVQSWQWYFGDGGTASGQNTSHVYALGNTNYTVKLVVTALNGCKDSISKPITTPPAFVADAGNDTTLCLAPLVTVQLNASTGGTSYSWTPAGVLNNPNIRNPIATISANTTFYVTVTNAAGCSSTDSVKIILAAAINPTLSISTSSPSICKGNSATFIANYTNGGSNPIFEWYKNNIVVGSNSNTFSDNGLNDGDIIKCKLISNIGCASPNNVESNTITMSVINAASNIRYPTVNTLYNQNLQLQARTFTGATYTWNPSVGLSNSLIINPVFNYTQSNQYLIKIVTPIGCTIIDTQLVVINGRKGLYVPKAFSPNNSGANDKLYPILVGIKQLLYFKIYNRWGILVFETNSGNPALGWNGTYKGQPQPVETYTWIAEAIDIDNIRIKTSGSTLLIR